MISETLASNWLEPWKVVSHLSHFGTYNTLIPF